MTDLEKKIQIAAQKYYTDGTSNYTDEEFDALVEQLKIEQPDSILFRVGWGYDVASDNTPGVKREHKYTTIGSLDKCHNMKELGKDFVGCSLDASTKLDGLSIVLYYENSLLKYALTRGDSFIGVDVTDKVLKIQPKFAKTLLPFTGAIRGECLMSFDNFEKFKQIHPEAKNPRNSTAGLINGKDVLDDLPYLDIVLYTLVHEDIENDDEAMSSVGWTREYISRLFGEDESLIVPYTTIYLKAGKSDEDLLQQMMELREELYRQYPADGIVLSHCSIGCKEGTYVYNAKAFKFPAESKVTKIIDVEWNMSKTKNCVPRILLEPIELSGTTVQACAGYHAKFVLKYKLKRGTLIKIRRSGEVIPQILEIFDDEKGVWVPCTATST